MNRALVLLAKKPVYGKVKTRLAKSVGKQKALAVYQKLLALHCDICSKVNASKVVFWTPEKEQNSVYFTSEFTHKIQVGEDLGEKMYNAIQVMIQNGFDEVVLIGTDCPFLTPELIENSFARLQDHDLVIGPAEDGGYYLIGMKKAIKNVFEGISWSSELVLKQTLEKCLKQNLKVHQLAVLSDIDNEKDLMKWESI